MNIDLLQVITNLTVAALTAWFSSKLALRQGIERARKEKAFERRLEWYEKAARTAMDFRQFNEEFALLLRKDDVEGLEKMVSGHLQLTSSMQRTINESIFFADKITYVQLKRVFKEFQRRMTETNQQLAKTQLPPDDVPQVYESMSKLMERACFDLAVSIRTQLGLDEITIQEFDD